MYLPCEFCNEGLSFDNPHVCDPVVLLAHIKWLKEIATQADMKADNIQNAVTLILSEMPKIDGETTEIKSADLQRLWEAAKCKEHNCYDVKSFLSMWLLKSRVLMEAYDLFQTKNGSLLKRLEELREAVDNTREAFGYTDVVFDLSPEDIVAEIIEKSSEKHS